MKFSIIIVSWNVRELLEKCLQTVEDHAKGAEVFVVDNASSDSSAEMVAKKFPGMNLIASNQNFGFAKGNNLALEQAAGDHLVLLNPDTELLPDTIAELERCIERNPGYGVIGGQHLQPDGSRQPSFRRLPTVGAMLLLTHKLHRFFLKARPIARYFNRDADPQKEQAVEQVDGSYFAISRKTLEQVGLLDEGYFNWFEEVDYCQRVADAGLEVVYCPRSKIIHHEGSSFGQLKNLKRQRIFQRSMLRFFKKHRPAWQLWLLRLVYLNGLGIAALAQLYLRVNRRHRPRPVH